MSMLMRENLGRRQESDELLLQLQQQYRMSNRRLRQVQVGRRARNEQERFNFVLENIRMHAVFLEREEN